MCTVCVVGVVWLATGSCCGFVSLLPLRVQCTCHHQHLVCCVSAHATSDARCMETCPYASHDTHMCYVHHKTHRHRDTTRTPTQTQTQTDTHVHTHKQRCNSSYIVKWRHVLYVHVYECICVLGDGMGHSCARPDHMSCFMLFSFPLFFIMSQPRIHTRPPMPMRRFYQHGSHSHSSGSGARSSSQPVSRSSSPSPSPSPSPRSQRRSPTPPTLNLTSDAYDSFAATLSSLTAVTATQESLVHKEIRRAIDAKEDINEPNPADGNVSGEEHTERQQGNPHVDMGRVCDMYICVFIYTCICVMYVYVSMCMYVVISYAKLYTFSCPSFCSCIQTLVMIAVQAHDLCSVLLLLQHGADVFAVNHTGKTVYDLACIQPIHHTIKQHILRACISQDPLRHALVKVITKHRTIGLSAWEQVVHMLNQHEQQQQQQQHEQQQQQGVDTSMTERPASPISTTSMSTSTNSMSSTSAVTPSSPTSTSTSPSLIHLTDGQGNQPLHYAALAGDVRVAAELLVRGADLQRRNKFGQVRVGEEYVSWASCATVSR